MTYQKIPKGFMLDDKQQIIDTKRVLKECCDIAAMEVAINVLVPLLLYGEVSIEIKMENNNVLSTD